MTGWIILSVVICFTALLLLSSVKIALSIADTVYFEVAFLGIQIYAYDSSKDKNTDTQTSAKPSKPKSDKKEGKLTSVLKQYAASKKKSELIKEIFSILKQFCIKFKRLLGHVRFKRVDLDLTVASSDAADTAILYGRFCSLLYPLLTLLGNAVNFDPERISVKCDFTAESISFYMSGVIKLRICFILGFVLSLAFSVIKTKIGDLKNVGTQH